MKDEVFREITDFYRNWFWKSIPNKYHYVYVAMYNTKSIHNK